MNKYPLAVYIGRFQPFHDGHEKVVRHGLSIADRVLVLIGSANQERTTKNPFTVYERQEMIHRVFAGDPWTDKPNVVVDFVDDYPESDAMWRMRVIQQVNRRIDSPNDVCLIGAKKDDTSWYLDFLPYDQRLTDVDENAIHATDIRRSIFTGSLHEAKERVHRRTWDFLQEVMDDDSFDEVFNQYCLE